MSNNKKQSPHTLYNTSTDSSQHYRLFLDDIIHDGAQIHDILNNLHDAGDNDTLEVRINSGGGYVKYGQQLINVIRGKFKDRSLTIIEAEAASMASFVFMAGSRRIAYEHSILMVHDISMFLAGKASESRKALDVTIYTIKKQFEFLFKGCLSQEEIDDVFRGVDLWFNAQEMCERKIVTHILTTNCGLMTAEAYLDRINNPNKLLLEEYKMELEDCAEGLEECKEGIEELTARMEELKKLIEELNVNENSSN